VALSSPTQELRLPSGRYNGSTRAASNPQPELDDHYLVALAKEGRTDAYDAIVRRYRGFVRLKASSYFLLGGESDDLIQEGLLGLYKAIRDYRSDRESSFRSFAELCITRQIITAVKTATRNKHTPLNQYVSFSQTPAAAGDSDTTLDEILPGPSVTDPVNQVIASEELESLVPLGQLRRPLRPREPRPLALPRRPLLRGNRRAARVRHEDRRQRPAAGQAQGRRPPRLTRGPRLSL
jgi:RNA polymerase sporulation-specific sigma factor